jgi:hypothetical protein
MTLVEVQGGKPGISTWSRPCGQWDDFAGGDSLVRMGRLELPRPCERWNLNPVRLPIPPHPLEEGEATLLAYHRAGFLIAAGMHDSAVQSSHRHRLQTLFRIRLA